MAIKGINFRFNGPTTGITNYNSSVTNLGTNIKQYSGATTEDIFAGPAKIGMARPMEQSTAIAGFYPHIITFSDSIDWCFLAENSTAAATRRIIMYEYNKETSEFNWKGFCTLTYPAATVGHTIRGFRVARELYTTGTIGVTGTTVVGSGTAWSTDRMSVGSRLGIGSTDPTLVSEWIDIGAITSDTAITGVTSASTTYAAGTPYVIEDIIILTSTINTTATNGGLFISKGISVTSCFSPAGVTIPAATTVDNIRAVYWLADAATVTNTTTAGAALQDKTSWTAATVYCLNVTGNLVYAYNYRKALTLASGKDTTTLTIKTGAQAVTGTMSSANNGRIGTLNHGPGAGVSSLYFVTTTRCYRAAISGITNGSTSWQSDVMVEIPPGGTTTYLAGGGLNSCEISSGIDRLVIASTGAAGIRSYVTKYNTVSDPFDHIFLNDDKQQDQTTSDNGGVPHPAILASAFSVWSENGILYLARIGATAALNQIYTIPIGAHQTYAEANNQMLITPKFDISDSNKLYNVSPKYIKKLGTDTFSLPTEPFKMYYRTSGIDDNTGGWTLLDEYGDLSGIAATEIQFMFIFKILGTTCIPSRIMGLSMTYEDNTTDSHYEPSVGNSSVTNRIFAYRQGTAWGSNIPDLRIRLYNAVTGALVLDDTVLVSGFGIFEYSTDGGSNWLAWNATADVVSNYIRYTATSLPNGIRIRSLLTQA
jgi:hypothetical protein